MNLILQRFDTLLCSYFGLEKSKITTQSIVKKGKELLILNTEPYKRQLQENTLSSLDIASMSREGREIVGLAVGKSIASNLIVSFDDLVIQSEK